MSIRPHKPQRGRPPGTRTFDADVAAAFGACVRGLREARDISQEALAHAADMERSYYGRIERGQSQPTLHVILKVASALSIDPGELVGLVSRALKRRRRNAASKNVGA